MNFLRQYLLAFASRFCEIIVNFIMCRLIPIGNVQNYLGRSICFLERDLEDHNLGRCAMILVHRFAWRGFSQEDVRKGTHRVKSYVRSLECAHFDALHNVSRDNINRSYAVEGEHAKLRA